MQYCGIINSAVRANVAQLFRALPCQGRGRELESLHSHHTMRLQMSLFCWLTLGLTLRELESLHSHHFCVKNYLY